MKKKFKVFSLWVCTLAIFAFSIGVPSLQTESAKILPSEIIWKGFRGFMPENEMSGNPYVLLKCGELPEFKDLIEEVSFAEKLEELADRLDGPDVPYWGEVVGGHGAGADGFFWVFVDNYKADKLNEAIVTEIVSTIRKVAKEIGFEWEVPIKFAWSSGVPPERAFFDRTVPYRPIIGGCECKTWIWGICTLQHCVGRLKGAE